MSRLGSRLYAVECGPGPGWRAGVERRAQDGWDAHAAFMDGLAAAGVVVLGGPLEDENAALLILAAKDEAAVRDMLAGDPWTASGILEVGRVRPWKILLEAGGG